MRNYRFCFLIHFLLLTSTIYAQIGGTGAYKFLALPASPRIAAMGGNFLTASDNDINLALSNPSLITPLLHNQLALNFVDYYSDINYGFVSYGRSFNKFGSFVGSVQYIDYGRFTYADEFGESAGNFKAGETALIIGWGRNLDSMFSIGANLKTIFSALETYNSFGLAVDVAGSYHTLDGFAASLIAKNIGRQLTTYTPGNPEPLPFELQFGISKKLQHMPFRYSILITNIQKWDLSYNDPSKIKIDPFTGNPIKQDQFSHLLDKAMRHVVVGGEFTPTKNLSIRFGYNYRLRQEMKVDSRASTVGLSWGIGIRLSNFQFNYARRAYHLEGSPNFVSVSTNLSKLF